MSLKRNIFVAGSVIAIGGLLFFFQNATVICDSTPRRFDNNSKIVVPNGCSQMTVKLVGGGGSTYYGNDASSIRYYLTQNTWYFGSGGGGGGVQFSTAVEPGENFQIHVGKANGSSLGGGSPSYIYRDTPSLANILAIAGGGGGSGTGYVHSQFLNSSNGCQVTIEPGDGGGGGGKDGLSGTASCTCKKFDFAFTGKARGGGGGKDNQPGTAGTGEGPNGGPGKPGYAWGGNGNPPHANHGLGNASQNLANGGQGLHGGGSGGIAARYTAAGQVCRVTGGGGGGSNYLASSRSSQSGRIVPIKGETYMSLNHDPALLDSSVPNMNGVPRGSGIRVDNTNKNVLTAASDGFVLVTFTPF